MKINWPPLVDPGMFAHIIATLELLNNNLRYGVNSLSEEMDQEIIEGWCAYHDSSIKKLVAGS